jgi:hypothetical protein
MAEQCTNIRSHIESGLTPLGLAMRKHRYDVAALLRSRGELNTIMVEVIWKRVSLCALSFCI